MRVVCYIIIYFLLIPTTAFAQQITGLYSAVTETEAVIELNLKKDNNVELITGYLPTEPDESFEPYVRHGSWTQSNGFIIIKINNLGTLKYKILKYLSYSEFGDEGGSFGLSPDKTNEAPFNRYGLWRKSDLIKHFKN